MPKAALWISFVLLALLAGEAGAFCPLCRNALEAPEQAALAQGFREGILFLLVIPFGLIGIIAALFLRHAERGDPGAEKPAESS